MVVYEEIKIQRAVLIKNLIVQWQLSFVREFCKEKLTLSF